MAETSRKKGNGRETMRADPPAAPAPIQERVARRAYELFERRGYEPGRDMDDWLEAERQVRGEDRARAATAGARPRPAALKGTPPRGRLART